jgi:hypothetical protein
MAEGDAFLYNAFKEDLLSKVHDLTNAADVLRATLHTAYTPNIDTHQLFGDAGVSSTEYGTAAGYTVGGQVLANQAVSQNDTSDRGELDFDDETWAALGALTPATPSDAILHNDTPASPLNPLIGYVELGTTATDGNDYTLQWAAPAMTLT